MARVDRRVPGQFNPSNPKLAILFAFLPRFASLGEEGPLLRMLELGLVFMATTFAAYGVSAASVRNHVISRPRIIAWMREASAAAYAALGAKLAVAERWQRSPGRPHRGERFSMPAARGPPCPAPGAAWAVPPAPRIGGVGSGTADAPSAAT